MNSGNMNIIYIRAYNGSLIPIKNVQLVTIDPNRSVVTQEIPMTHIMEKLMHHNMNNFVETKDNWKELDNYSMLERKK